jgi:hypothetical protein
VRRSVLRMVSRLRSLFMVPRGGGYKTSDRGYPEDLVHPYLCLEAPTPERPRTSKNTSKTFNGVLHQVPPPRRKT